MFISYKLFVNVMYMLIKFKYNSLYKYCIFYSVATIQCFVLVWKRNFIKIQTFVYHLISLETIVLLCKVEIYTTLLFLFIFKKIIFIPLMVNLLCVYFTYYKLFVNVANVHSISHMMRMVSKFKDVVHWKFI